MRDRFVHKDPPRCLSQTHTERRSSTDTHHVHDQVSTGIALVCRLLETRVLQHTGETEFCGIPCMPETRLTQGRSAKSGFNLTVSKYGWVRAVIVAVPMTPVCWLNWHSSINSPHSAIIGNIKTNPSKLHHIWRIRRHYQVCGSLFKLKVLMPFLRHEWTEGNELKTSNEAPRGLFPEFCSITKILMLYCWLTRKSSSQKTFPPT